MDQETREMLRQRQAAQRAQQRLLRDVTPEILSVALDQLEEQGYLDQPAPVVGAEAVQHAYLRYAPPWLPEAVAARLPGLRALIHVPPSDRVLAWNEALLEDQGTRIRVRRVWAFHRKALQALLQVLTTKPHSYLGYSWGMSDLMADPFTRPLVPPADAKE